MKTALDLHNDPIKKLIVKLTTPMMITGFVTTSYGFVDMIFASRLGTLEVASIAFVTPLFIMLKAFASGVTRGGVSIIATLLGEQEKELASAYATQLRLLILILSIIFAIPGLFLLPNILQVVGVSAELYQQALIYSQILFLSVPAMLIFQLYVSLFKSQGKMKVISVLSIFAVVCNALLNAVFLYLLAFKIDGLAYATLLTSAIQMLIIVFFYKKEKHSFNLGWRTAPAYSKATIWAKLLKVGLPLSFTQASSHFGFLVLNIFIVQFGHQAVAAFAIGNRINSLLFSPGKEIGGGLIPLIAQNWGRRAINRVKESIKLGLLYSLTFGILAAFTIQLIKYPIAHFLTKGEPETYQHVIDYVGLVGWTAIAWSVFHALQGIVNSFQKTMFTLVVNTVRLWGIRIPGILLFYAFLPSIAEYGIWYTMFISNTVTALFAIAYFMIIVPPMLSKQEEIEKIKSKQGTKELQV